MSMVSVSPPDLTDLEVDWAADGSVIITVIEGTGPFENRATLVLRDDAMVETLRAALARPKTDRQGISRR